MQFLNHAVNNVNKNLISFSNSKYAKRRLQSNSYCKSRLKAIIVETFVFTLSFNGIRLYFSTRINFATKYHSLQMRYNRKYRLTAVNRLVCLKGKQLKSSDRIS